MGAPFAGCLPHGLVRSKYARQSFLRVTSGAGGANASTMTLPLAWAADTVSEEVQLLKAFPALRGQLQPPPMLAG